MTRPSRERLTKKFGQICFFFHPNESESTIDRLWDHVLAQRNFFSINYFTSKPKDIESVIIIWVHSQERKFKALRNVTNNDLASHVRLAALVSASLFKKKTSNELFNMQSETWTVWNHRMKQKFLCPSSRWRKQKLYRIENFQLFEKVKLVFVEMLSRLFWNCSTSLNFKW